MDAPDSLEGGEGGLQLYKAFKQLNRDYLVVKLEALRMFVNVSTFDFDVMFYVMVI